MKKLIVVLCLGILLINCNSGPVEKPKDLISKEMMVNILYDLYLANAINSADSKYLLDRGITPAKYIYSKYKVDSLQFSRSDHYYATDVEAYEKLYKDVTIKLQKDKEIIDTLVLKNAKPALKEVELKSKATAKTKFRDSLVKTRLLPKIDLKDSIRN